MARRLHHPEGIPSSTRKRRLSVRVEPATPTERQRRVAEALALAAAYRAEHDEEQPPGMVRAIAERMHVDPSTAARYLRHPDASPSAKPVGAPRKRRSDRLWTDEMVRLAIQAWWDRYGRPPTHMDWSATQLRRRGYRATIEMRLAAWQEGWIDQSGVPHRFPRADRIRLTSLVEEVARARREADR
jgi:hypothetical protein